MMPENELMCALIDGGVVNDVCLDQRGEEVQCMGTLRVYYIEGENRQTERKLICGGVSHAHRHKMHWLQGSVFQGHTKLNACDAAGVLRSFGACKSVEQASIDTGLSRETIGPLYDRLRMAAALVAESQRESVVFEGCQVKADETVIRKEKVYEATENSRKRVGTIHHSVMF